MTTNDAFIRELLRAANDLQHVSYSERTRLAEISTNTIRGLQAEAEAASVSLREAKPFYAISQLAALLRAPGTLSEYETSSSLLVAVQAIRDLERLIASGREL